MNLLSMPQFIFLRGAPGAGKSSAARRLRQMFIAGVTLETDTVRSFLHSEATGDASLHRDVVGGTALLALHFQECGYGPVFIVGHITDVLLEEWEIAGVSERLRVYTLTASEAVLRSRLRGRMGHGFSDAEVGQTISKNVEPIRRWEEVVVDTSTLDLDEVCAVILNDLERMR